MMIKKPLKIGNIDISIVTEYVTLFEKLEKMMPTLTDEMLDAQRHWLEPKCLDPVTGLPVFSFHMYLVRTDHHTILIDTCVGNHKERKSYDHWHMRNTPVLDYLRAVGVQPEEVDFVMCTHLHVDHVGWNTYWKDGRWIPTFPNAKYVFGQREWDGIQQRLAAGKKLYDDGCYQDSILPIVDAGQALFVDDNFSLDNNLWVEPSPGHTPGHACFHIESQNASGLFTGDMIHHPIQIVYPDLSTIFCQDKALSTKTRRQFVEKYADTDTLIMPAHFPAPSVGYIRSQGGAFSFDFIDE